MSTPSIEHRVSAQGRRLTRVEEDVAALTDTVYKLHRRVVRVELIVTTIATHLGLDLPTDADVDNALDEQ